MEWTSNLAEGLTPEKMQVDPRVMAAAQRIADAADVDLTLSSGYRPGDAGNHGSRRALDINAINGVDIGDGRTPNPAASQLVRRVQDAARADDEVRENFGPAYIFKSQGRGQPQTNYHNGSARRQALQDGHLNHVHISVHP